MQEGVAVLFKRLADIDVFDLELDTTDVEEFVQAVRMLEPTFGGINLKDIRAPEGLDIYDRLCETLGVPVFHENLYSTAVVAAAALLNALDLVDKRMEEIQVVLWHLAEEAFDTLMTALGAYVDNVAQGAEDIILSAGMERRKQRSPIGLPAKVVNLKGRASDVLGTIRLRWKSVFGKKSYNVYMKLDGDPDTMYKLVAQPTKASITFSDLASAKYYWFRVEAVGAAGIGAVSDAAKSIAL